MWFIILIWALGLGADPLSSFINLECHKAVPYSLFYDPKHHLKLSKLGGAIRQKGKKKVT